MRNRISMLVGLMCLTTSLSLAQAQDKQCIVTDPTGTPLNVRNVPNGRILSKLENGKEVHIEELSSDARGRSWAKISNSNREILGWVFREFVTCDSNHAAEFQKQSKPASLITAIFKRYPGSIRYPYSLIQLGRVQYLVRDGKILQTKSVGNKVGGLCTNYANVWKGIADEQMRAQSEGEGSIWKLEGKQWKEIVRSSAGDWKCDDLRILADTVRKCLGVDKCF